MTWLTFRLWLVLALLAAATAIAAAWRGADLVRGVRGLLEARPSARRYPVRGVDVSHHQGAVDWRRVSDAGVHFAFVKATEGTDFHDRRFAENWRNARAAGVVVGAYHFFTFCSPGLEQARHFRAVVPAGQGRLPPAVDVEFDGNCRGWQSEASIRRELLVFAREVRASFGRPALVYTTSEALERVVPPELRDHGYWLRDLFDEPNPPGGHFAFWQYSASGSVPGIAGAVDLNVFAGSADEFGRRFAGRADAE